MAAGHSGSGLLASRGRDACVRACVLLIAKCPPPPDGLSEVRRGSAGPSSEADHRGRLSGLPGRPLLCQAGALR